MVILPRHHAFREDPSSRLAALSSCPSSCRRARGRRQSHEASPIFGSTACIRDATDSAFDPGAVSSLYTYSQR